MDYPLKISQFSSLNFSDWKHSFEKDECYFQPFYHTDEIRVQVSIKKTAQINFYLKYLNTNIRTQIPLISLGEKDDYTIYYFVLKGLNNGCYTVEAVNFYGDVLCYACFQMLPASCLMDTVLFRYTHRENDYDVIFENEGTYFGFTLEDAKNLQYGYYILENGVSKFVPQAQGQNITVDFEINITKDAQVSYHGLIQDNLIFILLKDGVEKKYIDLPAEGRPVKEGIFLIPADTDTIRVTYYMGSGESFPEKVLEVIETESSVYHFDYRVEGGFLYQEMQFSVDNNSFRDQRFNENVLSALPYEIRTLTLGTGYGVPVWVARKVNLLFSLSDILMGNDKYVRSEGSEPEIIQIDTRYPKYIIKIQVEPSDFYSENVIEFPYSHYLVTENRQSYITTEDNYRIRI